MKKIFLLLGMLFPLIAFGQETIDNYNCSYFEKQLDIMAADDDKLELYIQVYGDRESDLVLINLSGENKIYSFITFLTQLRDKYKEWRQVAIDNNVVDYSKTFDINTPKLTVAWAGSKWFFDFYEQPDPRFRVTSSGKIMAILSDEAQASSNEYITQEYYLVFSSVEEFDELLSKIEPSRIREKLKEKAAPDTLFQ